MFARVRQADAMKAGTDLKEQLAEQLQSAQSDCQASADKLQSTKTLMSAAQQQLQEEEMKLAAAKRELGQSGMQKFELSELLKDAQTQLTHQFEVTAKLQAKLRKHRASQLSLCTKLESANADMAKVTESKAELTQQLQCAQADTQQVCF